MSRNGAAISAEQNPGVAVTERQGLFYALVAVLFFSLSPVLTRWAAASLSAYEIAAGRLLTAGLVVWGLAYWQGQPLPGRQDWLRFALFGLITALHFALYIGSLQFTTIAHGLALLYTAPIFVAIMAWFWLGEGLTARKWLGVVVTVLGIAWLTGFEPSFTPQMLWGDLLAVGSALCYALYSVVGRSQRNRTSLLGYSALVYLLAGGWLLPLSLVNFQPSAYTGPVVLSVLALGLLPLALGHTLYNAALRHTNATLVNLIATQEITGGIVLGVLLLGETPSFNSVVGVLITLVGIVLVLV